MTRSGLVGNCSNLTAPGDENGFYLYNEQSGSATSLTATSCSNGLPIAIGPAYTERFSIAVRCIECNPLEYPSAPVYRWQLFFVWEEYSTSAKKIDWVKWISDPTCSPIIFSTLSDTVVCDNAATAEQDCSGTFGTVEPVTSYTACQGSTLTIDISE